MNNHILLFKIKFLVFVFFSFLFLPFVKTSAGGMFLSLLLLFILPGLLISRRMFRDLFGPIFLLISIGVSILWSYFVPLISQLISFVFHKNVMFDSYKIITILLIIILISKHDVEVFAVYVKKIYRDHPSHKIIYFVLPFLAIFAAKYADSSNNFVFSTIIFLIAILGLLYFTFSRKLALNQSGIYFIIVFGTVTGYLVTARTSSVIGIDQGTEYYLADLVSRSGVWTPSSELGAYSSSLAVTVLPSYLEHIGGPSVLSSFRYLWPFIFSLIPAIAYLCLKDWAADKNLHARKSVRILACYFLVQPVFLTYYPVPYRQIIAFYFASLMIYISFSFRKDQISKSSSLFILLGVGMILSHYSTTYIQLALITGVICLQYALKIFKKGIDKSASNYLLFDPKALLVLLCVSFVWYGPVTHVGSGLTRSFSESVDSIWNLDPSPNKISKYGFQSSLRSQFGFESRGINNPEICKGLFNAINFDYKPVIDPAVNLKSSPSCTQISGANSIFNNPSDSPLFNYFDSVVKMAIRLMVLIGFVILIAKYLFTNNFTQHEVLSLTANIIFLLILIIPNLSLQYDAGRTSQQLIFWLLFGFVNFQAQGRHQLSGSFLGISRIVFVSMIVIYSGILNSLFQYGKQSIQLSNQHDGVVTTGVNNETKSAMCWLESQKAPVTQIYAGYFSSLYLTSCGLPRLPEENRSILLSNIPSEGSYIVNGPSEILRQVTYGYYNGTLLAYSYPSNIESFTDNVYQGNGISILRTRK